MNCRFVLCLLCVVSPLTWPARAVTLEELNRNHKPLPSVPEAELPELKNQPEPFPGILNHAGLEAHTWVRFPFVENPGSLGIDPKGRVYVAEANRFWQGVPDLRGANELIRGDFQSVTVADRAKLYETFAARFPPTFFTDTADRILRLEDRDGNGAADHRTVFSDRFREPLDGLGFSVLAEADAIYFTCIPKLWKLTDADDDGVADAAAALVEGFGVRVSFIGHDLHGITRGPDGRLYFSVGDRGYHVTTKDGRVLAESGRGAIFRCESDGSGFEVVCRGLRNPQELAFDEAGNLFTFDNTGDIGDKARMVYALEGSDSGWDMSHQSPHHYAKHLDWEGFHPAKSAWVAEKMYDLFSEEQPQWVYPPAAHVAQGPSGVTWLTGETLPEDLRGKFLLANYRGAAQGCDVLLIGVAANGAGFKMVSERSLLSGVAVSDVELGYDGQLYLCDFGGGWSINTSGAVHLVKPKDAALQKAGQEMQAVFARGLKEETVEGLLKHLESPDKRLRQTAQFELVRRSALETLRALAQDAAKPVKSRLHGIWGLDQLGRQGLEATPLLMALAGDKEAEIRANAARALGSLNDDAAKAVLLGLLKDESPRVQSLAAVALGRVAGAGESDVEEALYGMAMRYAAAGAVDPVLRHSVLSALSLAGSVEGAVSRAKAAEREVRLLALLTLRRMESAELVKFLDDDDALIRAEAVRAIYDTKALDSAAGDAVAALSTRASEFPLLVQRRIVAANYRRGTPEAARRLVAMAGDDQLEAATRVAALQGLRLWEKQIETDPVLGFYRPQEKAERSLAKLGGAIERELRALFGRKLTPALSALALSLAEETGVRLEAATLHAFATDRRQAAEVRAAALGSLVRQSSQEASELVLGLLNDTSDAVAAAALQHGFELKLAGVEQAAREAIQGGPLAKARAGIAGLAVTLPGEITGLWERREQEGLRKELWLDVFLALQTSTEAKGQELAAAYAASAMDAVFRLSETGGDPAAGESVFRNQGACLQCHKVGNDGGIQGPDLTLVAERLNAAKLVESLVNPNAEISEGYGLASVTLANGELVMGRIAKETAQEVTVIGVDGKSVTLERTKIATIAPPVSAMPPLGMALPPKDLRDLVAYLSGLNRASAKHRQDDASHGGDAKEKIAK